MEKPRQAMSRSSQIGASLAAIAFIVGLGAALLFWLSPSPPARSIAAAPPAGAGLSQSERWAQAREAEAAALKEKCTTGLPQLMAAAQAQMKDGDPHMAAATINPCLSASSDPGLAALAKKIETARTAKTARLAKEEAARKKKAGVSIGMSKEDVLASNWGKPRKVNSTITARGTREQWVYDGGYLYFQDGTLVTIQN